MKCSTHTHTRRDIIMPCPPAGQLIRTQMEAVPPDAAWQLATSGGSAVMASQRAAGQGDSPPQTSCLMALTPVPGRGPVASIPHTERRTLVRPEIELHPTPAR